MAFSLQIADRVYSLEELANYEFSTGQENYILEAVQFLQCWGRGNQKFEQKTSGSTGKPKVIELKRQHMEASAKLSLTALNIPKNQPAILAISTAFIGGKMLLVRAIVNESPVLLLPPSTTFSSEAIPEQFRVGAWLSLVPLQATSLLNDAYGGKLLKMATNVLLGGGPVSDVLKVAVQQIQTPFYSSYGMTETCSHIALQRLNGNKANAYYQALPGVALSKDSRNCLVIDGPMLESPVVTNDVVELLSKSQFKVLGRADNIINSGGVKIMPEIIEAAAEVYLAKVNAPIKALASYKVHATLGQEVVLMLESEESLTTHVEQDLISYLKENLPKYWMPKKVIYVPEFKYLSSGKVDREGSRMAIAS